MKKHAKSIALLLSIAMLLGLISVPSVQDYVSGTFGYAADGSIVVGSPAVEGKDATPAEYTIQLTVTGEPVKDGKVTVGTEEYVIQDGDDADAVKEGIEALIPDALGDDWEWDSKSAKYLATEAGAGKVSDPNLSATVSDSVGLKVTLIGSFKDGTDAVEGQPEVTASNLEGLAVRTNPTTTEYSAGDTISLAGIELTATYTNGTKTLQAGDRGLTWTPETMSASTRSVEVTYTDGSQSKKASFNVTLKTTSSNPGTPSDPGDEDNAVLQSISLSSSGVKTSYKAGETLNTAGLVVNAHYSDNTNKAVTGWSTTPENGTALTTSVNSVLVSYTEGGVTKTASYRVTVTANSSEDPTPDVNATLQSIAITAKPTKTTYKSYDRLTNEGMVVTATYSDGTKKAVTGWTTNPADGAQVTTNGFKTVTVSYTEKGVTKTATYDIKVNNKNTSDGNNAPKSGPTLPESNLKSMLEDEDVREVYATDDVLVTVGATEHKLEYSLTKNGAKVTWKTMTDNRVVIADEGSYEFQWRVTDTSTKKVTTSDKYKIFIDYTAPATPTFETKADPKGEGLEVTINVKEDTGSALENIYYRIDDEDWTEYDKDKKPVLTLGEDGKDIEYTLEAYAIDKCENESDVGKKTVKVTAKDLLAMPTVKTNDKSPSSKSIEYKLDQINEKYTYEYQYVEKGDNPSKADWDKVTKTSSMEIDEEGEWELYIRVSLDGEEVQDKVAEVVIDRTAPVVKKVTAPTGSNTGKTVAITVEAEDDLSEELEYSFDNGAHWQTANSYKFKESTTIRIGDVQVRDACGNVAYAACSYKISITGGRTSCTASSEFYMKNNASFNSSAVSGGYMNGTSATTFEPDREIKRSEFAAVLNRTVNFGGGAVGSLQASDVPADFWAYADIVSVQRYNMFDTTGGKFQPTKVVTRGEVAHALCQFIDLDNINPSSVDLNDISGNAYEDDIVKVYAAGIMNGYGGNTFGPNDKLTRAQIVTIINRIINISDSAATTGREFDDVPTSHWAYTDIMKATRA